MKIGIEHLPRIAIMKVTGGLVGEESEKLTSAAIQVIEDGSHQLVIDLSDSGKMDSSGIGSLVKAYTESARQNGKVVLVMPSAFFDRREGIMCHPQSVFEIYRSREEAIDALLDLEVVPERIEQEAERKIAWVYRDTDSQRHRASFRMKIGCVTFLLGVAMLVIALLL